MVEIRRRALVAGATVAGLAVATGILALRAGSQSNRGSPAYFDAVTEDYRAGRVLALGGWIVSATEAQAFEMPEDQPGGVTTSSSPSAT